MSERQQILVPGIHVADTVTCRSCATLALLQTDAEADPPCLHAASKRSSRSGARCCAATAQGQNAKSALKAACPNITEESVLDVRLAPNSGASFPNRRFCAIGGCEQMQQVAPLLDHLVGAGD